MAYTNAASNPPGSSCCEASLRGSWRRLERDEAPEQQSIQIEQLRGQLDKGGGRFAYDYNPHSQLSTNSLPEAEEGLKEGSGRLQEVRTEAGARGRLARPQVISDHTPRLQGVPGMRQRQVRGGPHRGHEAGRRRPARVWTAIVSHMARGEVRRDRWAGPRIPGPTGRRTDFCTLSGTVSSWSACATLPQACGAPR